MRPPALASILALALCACGGGSMPPAPDRSPTPMPPVPVPGGDGWALLDGSPASPANARHDDIVFLDPANGWLVNTRGEVYRTEDGGMGWQKLSQFEQRTFPRCVGFADAQRGWVGNLNFTAGQTEPDKSLFETTDGGRTWANVSQRITGDTVVGLCGMRVVTPSVVVAVGRWGGPPVFVKTTDGGRSWTSRTLAPLATGLVDLTFFNEREGFAVGGLGVGYSEAEQRASRTVILATRDGGATWETRYTSAAAGQWAWKLQFVTDRVGYVTTEGPTPEGVILKTTDGGLSWQRVRVDAGQSFEGVAFVTPERGWVGAFPTLYSTTDGGASWRALGVGVRVNRMRVIGDSLAFASGDRVYRWTR